MMINNYAKNRENLHMIDIRVWKYSFRKI